MTNHNRVRISKLAIGLAIALAAAPAFAQNTTSALGGRISSVEGQAVAGAEVTIVHTESGSVSKATTDAEGRYLARGLRVGGPYTVTITKDGKTETREGVYLELAETGNVDVKFADATTLAAVQVTGTASSAAFDRKSMGATTSIGRDQLNGLASINRSLVDYARLDPRVAKTTDTFGNAQVSVAGQNNRYNSITIDSVNISDTFGLEGNNLPTAKQPVSIDAIQSVQVNVSNWDVTQKGYTGANINAVTKSGTNDFKGSLYYVFRNDSLAGDRYARTTDTFVDPPKSEDTTVGFTFGGPLIQDTLYFFTSYEEYTSSRLGPAFGPIGSSQPTIVGITPTAISGAQAIANTNWGFDAGTSDIPAGTEVFVKDALVKLDWNINDKHRANLRFSRTEQTEPFFRNINSTNLSLSSHWDTQSKVIESGVVQWFADWSDSFSTEFSYSNRKFDSEFANNSTLPQIRLNFTGTNGSFGGTRSLFFGTERSRQYNVLSTDTDNAYLAATWFAGDHEVKFGADWESNEVFNGFLQDNNGQYVFGCINSSAQVIYTFGAINCTAGATTAAQIEAAVLENFRRGRPIGYLYQQVIPGQNPNAEWALDTTGLFVQDTWSVNDKLTVNFGLRVDIPSVDTSPQLNTAAALAVIPGSVNLLNTDGGIRQTGGFGRNNNETVDGKELIQPRFGFNYTFDSERQTQFRGGVGLFQGAAANVWLSNPYSNTGLATRFFGCGSPSGASLRSCAPPVGVIPYPTFFSPDPGSQPTDPDGAGPLTFGAPLANVDFLSEDLKQPSVWKANLGFEHELPFWSTVFRAEYIYTKTDNGIYYKHLNLGQATRTGTDGRELYYTPAAYTQACWSASGTLSTSGGCQTARARALSNQNYNNVLLAENTKKGGGDSFTVSLDRPMSNNWSWGLAYTFTNATEVNPLTSSVSNSNFQNNAVFNPNDEVASRANYEITNRFSGSLIKRFYFFEGYKTEIGVYYEGRDGKPYSWTYDNDLNGDGVFGNDLMYIPVAPGSGEVAFRTPGDETRFWAAVEEHDLGRYAGTVMPRNSDTAPWANTFDIRVTQEFPGFMKGHKTILGLDIFNIGNLLNKRWGRIDEVGFPSTRSFVNFQGLDATGRYIYSVDAGGLNGTGVDDLETRQDRGESQWSAQFTLRYQF